MRNLVILSVLLMTPLLVFPVTYLNKTSAPITLIKKSILSDNDVLIDDTGINDATMDDTCTGSECMKMVTDVVCLENEPCIKTESIKLLEHESVVFENDQDQPVTIMSPSLNEKREFFPTNNSFNYDITAAKYSPKFPRITINRAA